MGCGTSKEAHEDVENARPRTFTSESRTLGSGAPSAGAPAQAAAAAAAEARAAKAPKKADSGSQALKEAAAERLADRQRGDQEALQRWD